MTIEEFRHINQQAGESLHKGELKEAGKLFLLLHTSLEMNTYHQRLSGKTFDKVFFGLAPDDVLSMLFNKAACHLNACKTKEALSTIKEYWMIEKDFAIYGAPDFDLSMNEIEAYRRLGDNKKALKFCDELLKTELESSQKVKVLIVKGSIESADSHWAFGINTLSLALAEAEADGKPQLIAKCYLELAAMIGAHYPALGLSFLWKARVHYEKAQEAENVAFCKTRMAMAYFLLWHRCQKKEVRFLDEAKRLVNEDLKREDFRHLGAQYSYDRLKGLLNNDLNLIETSIDFFEQIKAYGDFYRSVEFYIKTALTIGDREAAKSGAKRYEQTAAALNDQAHLNYIRSIDIEKAVACWSRTKSKKNCLTCSMYWKV